MAGASDRSNVTPLQAQETARLEEHLKGWREVLLALDQVLRWQRPWFPLAVIGFTTAFFLSLYYLDPSVLTGVSSTIVILSLADYLVPILASKIFGSSHRVSEQQRFHEICTGLVKTYHQFTDSWRSFFNFKERRPKMYFLLVLSVLLGMAWIGQQVHNLLLTHLIVTFILLLPGISICVSKYTGMVQRLFRRAKKNE
ncbi:ADP-ribosylation factor-like protein 6-interacting protein 1 isoform X2 [Clupea harengus]|uniref:ADP-ribosylation factor-like protein 6-interacting protein 1 isoform X2 n=1 Tax=Clupea harengus TaxID=7950 RepID=A0A6P8F687_CLUHA|nr:ADP-ribosylation factor-like protein 6-interacting protein 1 isoform X2 [Clupea harengus]